MGRTQGVKKEFYAISVERRVLHPAISAVTDAAREWLMPKR